MKQFLKGVIKKETLFVIVLLSIALRFVAINQSLWLDEAIGALVVKNFSYREIITRFPLTDNHPPLYYLVLKAWTDLYGYSEIALRSLSVVFGALTVVFIYKIAEVIGGTKKLVFPLLAALLLATSPLHIYYSQEARMYVMAGFLATAAIYYFLKTIKGKEKVMDWVFFSIFYTALIFTDYVPVFLYPVFPLFAFFRKKDKGWWFKFIAANTPLVALGYFWYPIFAIQSQKGDWLLKTLPAWQTVAGGATFKQAALVWAKFVLGRISLAEKTLYYLLVGFFSIPFAYLLYVSVLRAKKKLNILSLWLFLPLLLGFIASFWFPAFIYFRFIFVLPAFYLLLAKGVDKTKTLAGKWFFVSFLLIANLLGWGIYVSDKGQQREQWRQAVDYLEENVRRGDIVVFDYPEPFAPYQWYDPEEFLAVGVADSISADFEKTQENTKRAIKDRDGVYYFDYLVDLTDPDTAARKAIEESGFTLDGVVSFVGVGEISYYVRE